MAARATPEPGGSPSRPFTCSPSRPARSATSTATTASSSRRRCSIPGRRFRMADELLEVYLQQLIEAHAGVPEVTIAWQGGEPTLMGLEFFRRSVELAQEHLQPGQRAVHTIQTNGTKIDAEWAAFFTEHDFLVGLRSTGPARCTTPTVSTRAARASFDQVMRGLGASPRRGRRVERPDHDPRRATATTAVRSTLPPRRAAARASSSSSRSSNGLPRRTRTAPCPGTPGVTGRSTCRRATA